MRIKAKGIHWTRAKLADGITKIYWYAWKGGPRILGKYGTPEFIASYNEAIARRLLTPEGKLQFLIQGYQASQNFLQLNARAATTSVRSRLLKKSLATSHSGRLRLARHAASLRIGATGSRSNLYGKLTMDGPC
jgi:hypothetical protein